MMMIMTILIMMILYDDDSDKDDDNVDVGSACNDADNFINYQIEI